MKNTDWNRDGMGTTERDIEPLVGFKLLKMRSVSHLEKGPVDSRLKFQTLSESFKET